MPPRTKEHRDKLAAKKRGKKTGPLSESTRAKIAEKARGRVVSLELRQKLSENSRHSKAVTDGEKIWPSLVKLAKDLGMSSITLRKKVKKQQPVLGRLYWIVVT